MVKSHRQPRAERVQRVAYCGQAQVARLDTFGGEEKSLTGNSSIATSRVKIRTQTISGTDTRCGISGFEQVNWLNDERNKSFSFPMEIDPIDPGKSTWI